MIGLRVLQLLTLAIALAGISGWTTWAMRNPARRLYAVPPVTWLVNISLFFIANFARLLDLVPFSIPFINGWSSVVHLHAVILVFGICLVLLLLRHNDP